jgi:hypothetical protein
MAVEIGSVSLAALTYVSVRERAAIVSHRVPGLDGDLSQVTGRPSVMVELHGIFYGPSALADLGKLRTAYLDRKPLDFFADTVGEGYFTQVLIANLHVSQHAGDTDQLRFVCQVLEYVEPPEPALADPLGALDTGLLDEAAGFMDDVQNAVDQVSSLVDMVANAPSFANPTERLTQLPANYITLVSGSGLQALTGIRNLL